MSTTVYQSNLSNLSKREQRIVAHLRAGGRVGFVPDDVHTRYVWHIMLTPAEVNDYPELDSRFEWVVVHEEKDPGTAWRLTEPPIILRLDESLWRLAASRRLIYS
jgi:hypothetical protein